MPVTVTPLYHSVMAFLASEYTGRLTQNFLNMDFAVIRIQARVNKGSIIPLWKKRKFRDNYKIVYI